jgi:hypothetical protein
VRPQYPGTAVWTGPRPQTELVTDHAPSASEVVAFVGTSFVQRNRLKAKKQPRDSSGIDRWSFTYDGVPITGQEAVTSGHVTRIHPVMQDPPAVRRAELINAATAIENAELCPGATARLVYVPQHVQYQMPGTKGGNAMDYELVVGSYALDYEVEDSMRYVTYIDAYTGDVVDRVFPFVE